MARSVAEIKKTMTDAFIEDTTIREKYGLEEGDTFSSKFSSVSIENILFFIVAACCHVLEVLFDQYKQDVEERISCAVVASVPWYHKKALSFQIGDALVFDEKTSQYGYVTENEEKRIVKYAAVRDTGTSIQILVSGDENGTPKMLSNEDLTVFKEYMNRVKVAGVPLEIFSKESDMVRIYAEVCVDPLVIDLHGHSVDDRSTPVEDAIKTYLKAIVYGGTFNKTRLVDAIQSVPGVEDVVLGDCWCKSAEASEYEILLKNNYVGVSGSYIPDNLEETLSYVGQNRSF